MQCIQLDFGTRHAQRSRLPGHEQRKTDPLDGPRTTPEVSTVDRLVAGNLEPRCGPATASRPRRSSPSSASAAWSCQRSAPILRAGSWRGPTGLSAPPRVADAARVRAGPADAGGAAQAGRTGRHNASPVKVLLSMQILKYRDVRNSSSFTIASRRRSPAGIGQHAGGVQVATAPPGGQESGELLIPVDVLSWRWRAVFRLRRASYSAAPRAGHVVRVDGHARRDGVFTNSATSGRGSAPRQRRATGDRSPRGNRARRV